MTGTVDALATLMWAIPAFIGQFFRLFIQVPVFIGMSHWQMATFLMAISLGIYMLHRYFRKES